MQDIDAITQALDRWTDGLGRHFGPLSRPQRRMLVVVSAYSNGLRVSDLAAKLDVTAAGATRMIDKLETLGYVQRFQLPNADQRQVQVAVTAAGATALAEANSAFKARVQDTLAQLSAADRARLAELLRHISPGADHDHIVAAVNITEEHIS